MSRAAAAPLASFARLTRRTLLALTPLVVACAGSSPLARPADTSATPQGPPLRFDYVTIDGKPLTSESVSGRFTVLGFATTYDMASQAEARFLSALARHHTPRINVALLVLESAENFPLVEAFVAAMGLEYPVAIGDAATIAGEGPFAGLHHVPSVVVLDREGREVWRHIGLVDQGTLDNALREAEARAAAR